MTLCYEEVLVRLFLWHLLDGFLTVIHLAVVLILVFGWLWPPLREFHRWMVLVTCISWFGIGAFCGWGYCALTDWQWRVKKRLGIAPAYPAFIPFILEKIGIRWAPQKIDKLSFAVFIVVLIITIGLFALESIVS